MRCIVCGENRVKHMPMGKDDSMTEEDAIFLVEKTELKTKDQQDYFNAKVRYTTANNRMWDGGIVQILDAGYGSGHDTDRYVMAICDECVTKKQEDGLLFYFGNYMSPEAKWTKEEVEKSRIKYRRDSNLDNLVN